MHLWVFLCANPFRLRTRRTRDIRCSRTQELHQLYTLMIFGDLTLSKGNPQHCTLDFYTKVQVWGRVVKISLQSFIHTKGHSGKKKSDVSSVLLQKKGNPKKEKREMLKRKKYDKKGEKKKEKYIYMIKKEEQGGFSSSKPLLLPPRPMVPTH